MVHPAQSGQAAATPVGSGPYARHSAIARSRWKSWVTTTTRDNPNSVRARTQLRAVSYPAGSSRIADDGIPAASRYARMTAVSLPSRAAPLPELRICDTRPERYRAIAVSSRART